MSTRAFHDAADFVSTDQVRIEHNACSLWFQADTALTAKE